MDLRKASKYFALASILVLPFIFQNCVRGFETVDLSSSGFFASTYGPELQSVGITCQDPNVVTATDSRRLSRTELIQTYKALLGSDIYKQIESSVLSLPDDDVKKDPSTFPASFDNSQLEALDKVSRQLGAYVLSNEAARNSVFGSCSSQSSVTDSCLANFLSQFGKKAFRRPLTAADTDFFKGIYANAGSGKEGLSAVLSAFVLSPEFLYHVEVGKAGVGSDTQFKLTDYEVASRISYLLTDGPPDTELMTKADDGTLRMSTTLADQVDRLLQSPAGHEKIHRFFKYWLVLDTFQGIPGSANYLAGIDTNGLTAEMTRELYAFIDYIVYDKKGSYQDLLTSHRSFARTPALASIYGHAPAKSDSDILETDKAHAGVLLRSPVLANGTNQTHPILRGVFMLRRVLCIDIPSPSPKDLADRNAANFMPDPIHDSTAQMTAKQTSAASCMGCHSQINPLGFSFEGFDNLGRARTVDKIYDSSGAFIAEHPVQGTAGSFYLGKMPKASFADATELMDQVSSSVMGPSCFARQLHRFYQVRREASSDGCALMNSYGALQGTDGSILAAIKASVLNSYTDQRRIQ